MLRHGVRESVDASEPSDEVHVVPGQVATPHDQVIHFVPQLAIDAAGWIGLMANAMADGEIRVVLTLSEPRLLRFGPRSRSSTVPSTP